MSAVVRDVVMIGAGPSALTAAIYTTREDIDTVLYEKATIGGLAAISRGHRRYEAGWAARKASRAFWCTY